MTSRSVVVDPEESQKPFWLSAVSIKYDNFSGVPPVINPSTILPGPRIVIGGRLASELGPCSCEPVSHLSGSPPAMPPEAAVLPCPERELLEGW